MREMDSFKPRFGLCTTGEATNERFFSQKTHPSFVLNDMGMGFIHSVCKMDSFRSQFDCTSGVLGHQEEALREER